MRARSYATTAGKLRILGLSATRGAPTIDLAPFPKNAGCAAKMHIASRTDISAFSDRPTAPHLAAFILPYPGRS
jgi:hypothetical protein